MIRSASLPDKVIADSVNYSTHRIFGSPYAPKNKGGRQPCILPHVLSTLIGRLLLNEARLVFRRDGNFIWDEFELEVSEYSVRRALEARNWSKKNNRQVACERDPDL